MLLIVKVDPVPILFLLGIGPVKGFPKVKKCLQPFGRLVLYSLFLFSVPEKKKDLIVYTLFQPVPQFHNAVLFFRFYSLWKT